MDIRGRVVVVAGGASGLGAATVERMAAGGAKVLLLDLPGSDGGAVAAGTTGEVRFQAADITDDASLEAAFATARDWGEVRASVNCAGISIRTPGDDPDPATVMDRFRRVVDVNLVGTFNIARLAVAAMAGLDPIDDERGVIVSTASVAAYDGITGQAAYGSSKGGVAAMTLPLARDLSPHAIRVVTVVPGLFDTPMLVSASGERLQRLLDQVPFPKRKGRPSEYAGLVAHVIENQMINAECIRIDGGVRVHP